MKLKGLVNVKYMRLVYKYTSIIRYKSVIFHGLLMKLKGLVNVKYMSLVHGEHSILFCSKYF